MFTWEIISVCSTEISCCITSMNLCSKLFAQLYRLVSNAEWNKHAKNETHTHGRETQNFQNGRESRRFWKCSTTAQLQQMSSASASLAEHRVYERGTELVFHYAEPEPHIPGCVCVCIFGWVVAFIHPCWRRIFFHPIAWRRSEPGNSCEFLFFGEKFFHR